MTALPRTMVEKILSRTSGGAPVRAGDDIRARPDFVLAYDFPGYTNVIFDQIRTHFGGRPPPDPERFAIFIDHMVPADRPGEVAFHDQTRQSCRELGIACIEDEGIGHQVAVETGFATPGAFAVHFDGHVAQLGALGAFAVNMPRQTLIEAFVRSHIDIRVPGTVRVNLTGTPPPGVMARDIFHHILGQLGNRFARFCVLELAGPAIDAMGLDARQTMTGNAMFTGALSAMIAPEGAMLDMALGRARIALDPVISDPGCTYVAEHTLDLAEVRLMVAVPPSPSNVRPLDEVAGTEVQVGYLGSCAAGRIDDLRAAAAVLRGRQVRPGFALNVVPTSRRIMAQAEREGLLEVFAQAGAVVSAPSCDLCYGRIVGTGAGQRAVSTGTLNVRGRMGSTEAEILLVNAAVVAQAAILGRLPRSSEMTGGLAG